MKEKGFTLIELLAVIVILAIIALIAVPIILNIIDSTKKSANERSRELYLHAVEIAITNKNLTGEFNPKICKVQRNGNLICNTGELTVETKGDRPTGGEIRLKEGHILSDTLIFGDKDIDTEYTDFSGANKPDLYDESLTPVIYNGTNWVVADKNEKWYDYSNQEWANAVILNTGVTKAVDEVLNLETDVKGMFVWIPRYEYKIDGQYGKGGTSATPGEIDINFITKDMTTPTEGYIIHPAFTFGSDVESGIWVSKFNTTGTSDNPTVLPDQIMLGNQNISAQFATSQKFNSYITNADSHMMKNSEWGSVIYLSQSIYGKYGNSMYTGTNKEIYINIGVNFTAKTVTTGKSGGTILRDDMTSKDLNSLVSSACSYNDITNRGNGIGSCGGGASTTGNITGVYDISQYGAIWLMAVIADEDGNPISGYNSESNSGYSGKLSDGTLYEGVSLPDSKYYDLYTSTDLSSNDINISKTACNGGICYGHGLSETIDWYGDYMIFASSSRPWFVRGYGGSKPSHTGVFAVGSNHGNANPSISFRVVLAKTK